MGNFGKFRGSSKIYCVKFRQLLQKSSRIFARRYKNLMARFLKPKFLKKCLTIEQSRQISQKWATCLHTRQHVCFALIEPDLICILSQLFLFLVVSKHFQNILWDLLEKNVSRKRIFACVLSTRHDCSWVKKPVVCIWNLRWEDPRYFVERFESIRGKFMRFWRKISYFFGNFNGKIL